MYIESVPNRNSPPAILLRESFRQNGQVRKRLRGVLKGGTVIPAEHDAFTVTRSLAHGHVAAALGAARKIGLYHFSLAAFGERKCSLYMLSITLNCSGPIT